MRQLKENLDACFQLCSSYNVKRLEIFGSALNKERFNVSGSDLDFLVEFLPLEPILHAKNYFGLLKDLQNLFNRSIDLVESKALKNPYFLKSVTAIWICPFPYRSLAFFINPPPSAGLF